MCVIWMWFQLSGWLHLSMENTVMYAGKPTVLHKRIDVCAVQCSLSEDAQGFLQSEWMHTAI